MNAITNPTNTAKPAYRMLSIQQVEAMIGLGRSTVYNLMDTKSPSYDPSFPTKILVSKGRVAWIEAEVEAWLGSKIMKSRAS